MTAKDPDILATRATRTNAVTLMVLGNGYSISTNPNAVPLTVQIKSGSPSGVTCALVR